MKDSINIFLMAVVVLGWAILEITDWGYAVLAIPVVYWLKPLLDLLHKYFILSLTFWILVAVFSWQAALVGWLYYRFLITPKDTYANDSSRKKRKIRLILDGRDVETGENVNSPFW
ncbi:hypothetical protein [Aeromonas jandaei]|uniref:hypothetical protein n=1 Tax=Aeromonas jandaei TaxID=650 RepID=UPI003BA10BFE